MESLRDIVAILRHEGRQDLAALLFSAFVDFEYVDTGFSMTSDAEFELSIANIYSPMAACKALRELSNGDKDIILNALQEVWPCGEGGGMVIQSVSYSIDKDSLRDDITELYANPIGWHRVDRTTDRIRELLATASTVEHFQEVGVLCREALISMAQAVFDPKQHPTLSNDNTDVSQTDVKRMIARYVSSEYPGARGQEIRKCVHSTVDLANQATHRRNSDFRDAALCAQATMNAIGLIAVISGKRDRGELHPSSDSRSWEYDDTDDLPF